MSPDDFAHMANEIKALKKVNHPSIGKYLQTYEDERKVYQMMELGAGGELFDNRDACIQSGQPYTERKACVHIM